MAKKHMLDLFDIDQPGARNSDPWTSHEAASLYKDGRITDRVRVLLAHSVSPLGLTDFQLADIVHRQQTSAGKRRLELMDKGLIEQTDQYRLAPSGSRSIVWRITTAGIAVAKLITERGPKNDPAL
jgi:hypothetical protein